MAWRKAKWLLGALGMLAFLGICRAVRAYDQMGQEQIAIYSITRNRLLDFFDGQDVVSFSDSVSAKQILFAAQPNRWASGMRSHAGLNFSSDTAFAGLNLLSHPPFVLFFDQKIAVVDDSRWLKKGNIPSVAVDVLLLSKNPPVSIAACRRRFPFKTVVFDATNSRKQAARWKAECAALGVSWHDVREQGAWVSD